VIFVIVEIPVPIHLEYVPDRHHCTANLVIPEAKDSSIGRKV